MAAALQSFSVCFQPGLRRVSKSLSSPFSAVLVCFVLIGTGSQSHLPTKVWLTKHRFSCLWSPEGLLWGDIFSETLRGKGVATLCVHSLVTLHKERKRITYLSYNVMLKFKHTAKRRGYKFLTVSAGECPAFAPLLLYFCSSFLF